MNRVVGDVMIIDSAMGNAFVTTSASSVRNLRDIRVNSIAISMADTTGTMTLTFANTTDVVVILNRNMPSIVFGSPQEFQDLKVPTLTNTTGFLYLA